MKRFFICLLLVLLIALIAAVGMNHMEYFKAPQIDYGNLPVIRINTENQEMPKDKENYVNCSFEILNCANAEHNFTVEMKESYDSKEGNGGVGVRLRGNTTMAYEKKPYRIKFKKDQSLFGLTEAKSWVLLADYLDQSKIRNYAAMTLGNDVFDNLDFTATPHHVILEFNGEYQGVYLLCEQMDEKEGRSNVEIDEDALYINYDKTEFPFMIEMDNYASTDPTIADADRLLLDGYFPIEIKYPESKDRGLYEGNDVIYAYIEEYMLAVQTTLKTKEKITVSFRDEPVGYEDLIDVDSLIDYVLLNELMYNPDSIWKSSYMHKSANIVDEETGEIIEYGKLKFGPVWDFDAAMSYNFTNEPYDRSYIEGARATTVLCGNIFFIQFIQDEENYLLCRQRWEETRGGVKGVVDALRDYKATIKAPSRSDALVYYGNTGVFQFDMQYDYVRLFLLDRIDYFDEIFALDHKSFLREVGLPTGDS